MNFLQKRWESLKLLKYGSTNWDKFLVLIFNLTRMLPMRLTDSLTAYVHMQEFILSRLTVTHRGKGFKVGTRDSFLHLTDEFEEKLYKWLARNGGVFIDAGANVGKYSITLSDYYDQIYAFEPSRDTYSLLIRNIELNSISNVVAENKALGNMRFEEELYLNPLSGRRSLIMEPFYRTERVQMVPLDDYNLKEVSLIKIDVEGAEALALKGMERTINKNLPDIIIEVKKHSVREVMAFFKAHDYVIADSEGHENYVFVPKAN